ncbi:MAG TPA: GNAT family N-acetyltransferase [Acidimicrobiales bacterium]|nr:GNAT family N-acetyltransferase [Acidimicrobiales bacterium]
MSERTDSSCHVDGPPASALGHFVAWRYPDELEADIVVRTGPTLRLRPIRQSDVDKLVTFHGRLSFDSIYRRYFSLHAELTPQEVRHLTIVDYVDRLALVIEDGDDLIAVGRYDRYPRSTTAEVAFVVLDNYQHLGLGHRLLEHLAEAAWKRGIATFTAETLVENRDMMSIFRHSGFPVTTSISCGEISINFSIEPNLASATSRSEHRDGTT